MRYVTRSWVGDDVIETSHELNDIADYTKTITVIDNDPVLLPVLLNHRGEKLYRVPDRVKFGFAR